MPSCGLELLPIRFVLALFRNFFVAHRSYAVVVVGALVMISCSSPARDTLTMSIPIKGGAPTMQWLPCGVIECGTLSTSVDHTSSSSEQMTISVYRRLASDQNAPVLLLLADNAIGSSARTALEKSVLTFGVDIKKFTVVSMAIRGAIDAVLPTGSENFVGALDTADDIEVLRVAFGVEKILVIALGTSATATAAWVMKHPQSAQRVVLDTPEDPSVAMAEQDSARAIAMADAVLTAMRWCASHLSCPNNAKVALTVDLFKKKIKDNRFSEGINLDSLARVAETSLIHGRPIDLFQSISSVRAGNTTAYNALAGPAPTVQTVQRECRNSTLADSKAIAANHVQLPGRYFPLGNLKAIYEICLTLPESTRPIGSVVPDPSAIGAHVMVTTALQDPMWSAATVEALAKRMKWTYNPVKISRHLAIGHERAITAAAIDFLQEK